MSCSIFFFFKVSFKVSTHLKVVLLQKPNSVEEGRKEGEGTWRRGHRGRASGCSGLPDLVKESTLKFQKNLQVKALYALRTLSEGNSNTAPHRSICAPPTRSPGESSPEATLLPGFEFEELPKKAVRELWTSRHRPHCGVHQRTHPGFHTFQTHGGTWRVSCEVK